MLHTPPRATLTAPLLHYTTLFQSVIATDSHRIGTNALLFRPPLTIAYCYGSDSLAAHRRAAHAAGLTSNVIDRPGLARDIDMPEDLLSSNLIRCAQIGRTNV